MGYLEIYPSECLGDSLYKINSNALDFDTRLVSLSARTPQRAFGDTNNYDIWIDSGVSGNDLTGNGTLSRPFKTIAAAVSYYSREVAPKGVSARFRLAPGVPSGPKVYKGATCLLGQSTSAGSNSSRNRNAPTISNPYETYTGDRTLHFLGDPDNPDLIVIESTFTYARGTNVDFWNANGLLIDYPEGSVIVSGITFKYNAVGNLPSYNGSDQYYNDKTDKATHLTFSNCHYAKVDNCRFEQMIDSNNYDISEPGWTGTNGLITQPSQKYMFGINFDRCYKARITEITIAGTMNYIAKSKASNLSFEVPGSITLENNPRFYSLFSVEEGGSVSIEQIWQGSLEGFTDTNYTLRFSGACAAPLTSGGKRWYNYTFSNYETRFTTSSNGASGPQAILCPSQGASPSLIWPTNTTPRLLYVNSYYTQTGINNNVYYNYVDTGRTAGTGNPRNV